MPDPTLTVPALAGVPSPRSSPGDVDAALVSTSWSPSPAFPPVLVDPDPTPAGPDQRVMIGNVNPGTWSTPFATALLQLFLNDPRGHVAGIVDRRSGANISKPRNEVVQDYLDRHADDAHWLLFLDSDMVPRVDVVTRLLAAARAAQARVVGALTVMDLGEVGWVPNLFQFAPAGAGYTRVQFDFPDGKLVQVAATGAACILIHRDVLTEMAAAYQSKYAWFGESVVRSSTDEHWLGEDVTFCTRAVESIGERIFIDCNTWVGHARGSTIHWPPDARRFDPNAPIGVVVPMKDKHDLTAQLLAAVRRDRPLAAKVHTWILDNGSSDPASVQWLASLAEDADVTVVPMPEVGIHAMWNEGARQAVAQLGSRVRVVFLNNDVVLAPGSLGVLSRAMADHPDFALMSFNYDGRAAASEVVEVHEICANRYDGRGGLAGFAFAARGEMISGGYTFPEDCRWWFGDNDIVDAALFADQMALHGKGFGRYRIGIAVNARCEHLGGATAGDWSSPEWREITAQDQVAFERRHAARWAGPVLDAALAAQDWAGATRILAQLHDTEHLGDRLALATEVVRPLAPVNVLVLGLGSGVEVLPWLAAYDPEVDTIHVVDPDPLPGWLRPADLRVWSQSPTTAEDWGPEPFDVVILGAGVDQDLTRAAHASAWGPITVTIEGRL